MGIIGLIRKGKIALKQSVERFPIAIILSITVAISLIYMNEAKLWNWENGIKRVVMVLALGVIVYLSIQLFLERKNKEEKKCRYIYYGIGAVLLIAYSIVFLKEERMVEITRYIGFMFIFILLFLVIPYIKKDDNYEIYIIKILERFFITVIYSMVLYLGIAAILFTINYLLEVKVKGELYYYTFLLIGGGFAPCYFLGGIPGKNEKLTSTEYPKVLKVLMLYIIMPLITIYTIILYIYFGKIIITRTWPQGLVSHLVLWYGVISTGTLFLIDLLRIINPWAKKFYKIFPKTILPLMIMMFISMGIRINAYGITENRYFVLALGIWITGIMMFYSFTKKRRNTLLPISVAIVIIIAICGPLSSYSLSKFSQNKRFEKIIENNNMLINGKIVKAPNEISKEDQQSLSSIINYFENNHSLSEIRSLPKDLKIEDVEKILGIKDLGSYDYDNNMYFYFGIEASNTPISIEEYNYYFDVNMNSSSNKIPQNGVGASFDKTKNSFNFYMNGEKIYSKDLDEYVNELIKDYGVESGKNISFEKMKYEDETEKVKVLFILKTISGRKEIDTNTTYIEDFELITLVKIK